VSQDGACARTERPTEPGAAGCATGGDEAGDSDEAVVATNAGLEPAPQRLILDDWRRDLPLDGDPVGLELAGQLSLAAGWPPPSDVDQERASLITGQTKLVTTPMSVAAPAANAAATSSSLSKSPLSLASNAATAAA
jgi:hypothetical protein